MSVTAREQLVRSPDTFFQRASERSDLLDPDVTQTSLIALLLDALKAGFIIEFTAVVSDHSDDSAKGLHSHHNGYAVDCWPLASSSAGDYLDAGDSRFANFLRACASSKYLYQIGLASSAWTLRNQEAAGSTVFHDDGDDHVHLGAKDV